MRAVSARIEGGPEFLVVGGPGFSLHGPDRKSAEQQRWSHSGLTQHMETCKAHIEGPVILHNSDDRMKNPKFDLLRVIESL